MVEVLINSLSWSSCTSKVLIITNSKLLWIESSRATHILELLIIEHLIESEWAEEIIHELLLLLPLLSLLALTRLLSLLILTSKILIHRLI